MLISSFPEFKSLKLSFVIIFSKPLPETQNFRRINLLSFTFNVIYTIHIYTLYKLMKYHNKKKNSTEFKGKNDKQKYLLEIYKNKFLISKEINLF